MREQLRRELPWARLAGPDAELRHWTDNLQRLAEGKATQTRVPLDVRGSRFQRRVWDAIRSIPRGETRSYSELARACGQPAAARAVARACGANPTALATPCHRVIRGDGGLGGYAWGLERKRALLAREGVAGFDAEDAASGRRSSPAEHSTTSPASFAP